MLHLLSPLFPSPAAWLISGVFPGCAGFIILLIYECTRKQIELLAQLRASTTTMVYDTQIFVTEGPPPRRKFFGVGGKRSLHGDQAGELGVVLNPDFRQSPVHVYFFGLANDTARSYI
jgi:hypothetical protein